MKYLKNFEKVYTGEYWLIPTDDRMKQAMIDIGCTNRVIHNFLNNRTLRKNKYVYLGVMKNKSIYDDNDHWTWNYTKNNYDHNPSYEYRGYKNMGKNNIHDAEIDANKYNL